jgi:hypothetical protein
MTITENDIIQKLGIGQGKSKKYITRTLWGRAMIWWTRMRTTSSTTIGREASDTTTTTGS